jgi:hypothetical protein
MNNRKQHILLKYFAKQIMYLRVYHIEFGCLDAYFHMQQRTYYKFYSLIL